MQFGGFWATGGSEECLNESESVLCSEIRSGVFVWFQLWYGVISRLVASQQSSSIPKSPTAMPGVSPHCWYFCTYAAFFINFIFSVAIFFVSVLPLRIKACVYFSREPNNPHHILLYPGHWEISVHLIEHTKIWPCCLAVKGSRVAVNAPTLSPHCDLLLCYY